jgi:hypothetical protein
MYTPLKERTLLSAHCGQSIPTTRTEFVCFRVRLYLVEEDFQLLDEALCLGQGQGHMDCISN